MAKIMLPHMSSVIYPTKGKRTKNFGGNREKNHNSFYASSLEDRK